MRLFSVIATLAGIGLMGAGADARAQSTTSTPEKPGPSAAQFAKPPYQCAQNVYVSNTGSDSAAGTQPAPWRTIQRAARAPLQPGTCVNVMPGWYTSGAVITIGGNAATPTGYIVYRCTTMLGCTIADPLHGFSITASGAGPNYVMFDGFKIIASSQVAYGLGIQTWNWLDQKFGNHHIWALNNEIANYGQGGISMNDGEYFYAIHNTIYNTANVTCDAQGSGISLAVLKPAPNYTPTSMDKAYGPFNNTVSWNYVYNNKLTRCGTSSDPYDTDGNGIIFDTLNNAGSTNVLYPNQSLAAFNVVHDNGGFGIKVFRGSYVTLANNTSYNNNTDSYNQATYRAEIGIAGGANNTVINNIAYAVSGSASPLNMNAAFGGGSAAGVTDKNNVWLNNISYQGTPPYHWGPAGNVMFSPDALSCSSNKCNVNPWLETVIWSKFTPGTGSPAIGYGTARTWLSTQASDAGACYHTSSPCP